MVDRLKVWWAERVVEPVKVLPRSDILRALLLGTYGGLFPIPGVTTGIVTILMLLCKLSGITLSVSLCAFALTVNLLLTPIELALIPVLSNIGVQMLAPGLVCPWTDIHALSWVHTVNDFSICIAGAILVWSFGFPFIALAVIYAPRVTTFRHRDVSPSEAILPDTDLWTASLLLAPNTVDPLRAGKISPERRRHGASPQDDKQHAQKV
eukprot:GEMP01046053.1.p1 GENE.GEMP01046053.1~~GEMP01046053.1.p1  ORF type:complete len:209 (+),score=37.21 GEMP01046053.1:156-782(+)